MKIGLIIYDQIDIISGGYLYDRMLYQYLRQKGEQVEIISLPKHSYLYNVRDNFSKTFYQRLRAQKFDLILEDELSHPSLFLLNQQFKNTLDRPIVAIVHHLRSDEKYPGWQKSFYQWVEKRYLTSVDAFIVNSTTTLEAVGNITKVSKPSVVAKPGKDHLKSDVTENQIRKRLENGEILKILFVGNIIPRKNLHILLNALAAQPSQKWQLSVVGDLTIDQSYTQEIMKSVTRKNLLSQVKFLGAVSNEELAKKFRHSHLLIVPSSYEGFGIVYLEAMGFGLPCIASSQGATKEFIMQGKEGFRVKPEDVTTLSSLINQLIENRELLLKMSLTAYKNYTYHNTWEQSNARIHQFLKTLN